MPLKVWFLCAILCLFSLNCSEETERGSGLLLGPAAGIDLCGGAPACYNYLFIGEVDNERTPSCGSVSAGSSEESSSSSPTSTARGEGDGPFTITSFYRFKNVIGNLEYTDLNMSMALKYSYSPREESFSLSPLFTCQTFDYVTCDASGPYTCGAILASNTTTPTYRCDTNYIFDFNYKIPHFLTDQTEDVTIHFRGLRGTIRWGDGEITLNSENTLVTRAEIKFDMIGSDQQSIFQGEVTCESDTL